jgi:RNA polymerase sigma-70 factor (ECF subfamily)
MDEKRGRFEAQVLLHLDAAYRYARWLARSATDADDVLQEATLRAYRSFEELRGADGKAWLLTIVRNCHLSAAKQRQRRNFVSLPEDHDEQASQLVAATPDPESAAIDRDERRMLQRLMAGLTEEQREVLALREIEDMDYREIAAVTGVPIGTVMSRLARARTALRSRWQQEARGELHGLR